MSLLCLGLFFTVFLYIETFHSVVELWNYYYGGIVITIDYYNDMGLLGHVAAAGLTC